MSFAPGGPEPRFHADPGLSAPPVEETLAAGSAVAETGAAIAAAYALTAVPALNSLPGAAASLFLDFDGHFEAQWGSDSNITTPAFDQDGDPATLSDGELASIRQIWEYVAEDYSPFKINVTTVEPPSFANGAALRVSIGGDGSWSGGVYGGVAYVDSFTNSIANTVYVFTKNLANGNPKYTAEASSHEAGHGFGLEHQSLYDANGSLVQEYYQGPGDGRAPIMGVAYYATRGLWWYGTSLSSTIYQDDMAVLARAANGFGYRPDDHGNTVTTATPLAVSGNQVSGSGIIATTSDLDYFSLRTDAGQITLSVSVPAKVNDLDARLELRDALGGLVASAAPTTSFGAAITANVGAGSYRLVVASNGGYGDVGQYSVSGTIIPPAGIVNPPTNLTATVVSSGEISLTWTDNADNETIYAVSRSTDGVNWVEIAGTLPANSTRCADIALAPGTTYHYLVRAVGASTSSDSSNEAIATTAPTAPTGLAAAAVSSTRIDLAWTDVAGETGYRIERSVDQQTWAEIAATAANVTNYQNAALAAATTYYYRVRAVNSGGSSDYSSAAAATTLPAPVLPAAPSGLTARAVSARQVDLAWTDNSADESGFIVERSGNGGKSWSQIARTGANVAAYSAATVSARKTYTYRVRSYNDAGSSAPSNVAAVTTPSATAKRAPAIQTGRFGAPFDAAFADYAWLAAVLDPPGSRRR